MDTVARRCVGMSALGGFLGFVGVVVNSVVSVVSGLGGEWNG